MKNQAYKKANIDTFFQYLLAVFLFFVLESFINSPKLFINGFIEGIIDCFK